MSAGGVPLLEGAAGGGAWHANNFRDGKENNRKRGQEVEVRLPL